MHEAMLNLWLLFYQARSIVGIELKRACGCIALSWARAGILRLTLSCDCYAAPLLYYNADENQDVVAFRRPCGGPRK